MELLPSFDARERLLDALAHLGARVGWEPFVANRILTPEPKWFPDAWSPDRRGAAWFSGIEDGTCRFGIDPRQLEREDSFVAALGHETAHAYRRHHGVEIRDRDREEDATDLTAVFLGFGVLALNASDLFETSGALVAGEAVTKTYSARLGYLSTPSSRDRRSLAGEPARVLREGAEGARGRALVLARQTRAP